MLENLHVKNLALIKEEDIAFKEGFNVLTGETGAGKSVVIGSIDLALGGRANTDVIRSGEEYALIELTFLLNEREVSALKEMDIYPEEDGRLILSRRISKGKSVCRINGETVGTSQAKALGQLLLNIYGQHEHQGLLKKSTYSDMLDEYAGGDIGTLKSGLKALNLEYRELLKEKEGLGSDEALRKREAELLSFEIEEIENADLREGEDEELFLRHRFLSNVQRIKEAASEAYSLTGYEAEFSAGTLIGRALGVLRQAEGLDDKASSFTIELSQIEALLNDFNRSLSDYADGLSFDGEEYANTDERLREINRLKDKYGGEIKDIISLLDEKRKELLKLENFEEYAADIEKRLARINSERHDKCAGISALRKEAALKLSNRLVTEMRSLNFNDVRLEISVCPDEENISDDGFDDVEFLISLNTGEELKPMQNVASGGELSRIMLAFKSVFASKDDVSTLVFDEIDTGISGITAYKVSEMMGRLSKEHQLICITHLPQIAAMADSHYLIEKSIANGRTVTNIEALSGDGALNELARLLGSDELSEASLNNAKELKEKALIFKKGER